MELQTNQQEAHHGGCLCGNVRYVTLGSPRYQAVCHCTFCQRLTGSAFLVEAVFLREDVTFSGYSLSTYAHRSQEHGRILRPQFCPNCGTTVAMTMDRWPHVQAIFCGTFDDPNWVAIDKHIFTETALHWMVYPAGVTRFKQHSLKADGTPAEPLPD